MGKPTGASEEVRGWLEKYTPAGVSSELWVTVRPLVVSLPAAVDWPALDSARRFARLLTRLAAWCVGEGIPLEAEAVLDPDTVERFCSVALTGDRSRGTYRAVLRRVGPELTRRAPWTPPADALSSRRVAAPYSPDELEGLRTDATRQSTAPRRRAARALIALGVGAGLDGRWVTKVEAADVVREEGAVTVRVGEPCPRVIPVRAEFEDEVWELAESAGGEFLVGGRSRSKNRAGYLVERFESSPSRPAMSAARLRSTWLVHCLAAGVRLPELVEAAGLSGATVLSDLLAYVPVLHERDRVAMLRGVASR